MLTPTYSIISYGESFDLNHFDLRLFGLHVLFSNQTKEGLSRNSTCPHVSTIPWKSINAWRYIHLDT